METTRLKKATGEPIKLDITKLVFGHMSANVKPYRLPDGTVIAVTGSADDAVGYCKFPRQQPKDVQP